MTINEIQLRQKIGRFVLLSNLVLILSIFILYPLRGFTDVEFTQLLKLLVPVKAVYLTAMIKYVLANKRTVIEPDDQPAPLNPLFSQMAYYIITSYMVAVIFFTWAQALFNLFVHFETLLNVLLALETFFGVYVGLFMAEIFKIEVKKETT